MVERPISESYLDALQVVKPIKNLRDLYAKYGQEESLDKINQKIESLQKFWGKYPELQYYSSGYGISLVCFVPKCSGLYYSLITLMNKLEKTEAARLGKVIFCNRKRLHMTIYGLDTGYPKPLSTDCTKQSEKTIKDAVQTVHSAIENSQEQHPLQIVYGKDVFISPKARIGINGYKEGSGLDCIRNDLMVSLGHTSIKAKGEHINVASIIQELTNDELRVIQAAIQEWKNDERLSGWLDISKLTLVSHKDDHLVETWEKDIRKKIKQARYIKYASALRSLIGLTEKQLDQALPGRRDHKYDSVTLHALEFEGISVIHNIDSTHAREMKLSEMAQEFREELINAGLENMIAFVDLDSFHITTFDLINEPETSKLFESADKYTYKNMRNAVEAASLEFIENGDGAGYAASNLRANVRITGVGMFPPGIVKLTLTIPNEEERDKFNDFRQKLQHYLLEQIGDGYKFVREKVGKLSSHITLGYTMNSISEQGIEKFINILKNMNKKFKNSGEYSGIKFDLTQGKVTQFTDMNHYNVIPADTDAS